jgi:hypothetical protein
MRQAIASSMARPVKKLDFPLPLACQLPYMMWGEPQSTMARQVIVPSQA